MFVIIPHIILENNNNAHNKNNAQWSMLRWGLENCFYFAILTLSTVICCGFFFLWQMYLASYKSDAQNLNVY